MKSFKKLAVIFLVVLLLGALSAPAMAAGPAMPEEAGPVDILVNFGWVIFAGVILLVVIIIAIIKFFRTPRKDQLESLRKWLLQAVIAAEGIFGSKTGEAKLSFVYDLFVARFPWLAKIIKFEKFAEIVDDALKDMERLLQKKPDLIENFNENTIIAEE